jgi:hypothetical protein
MSDYTYGPALDSELDYRRDALQRAAAEARLARQARRAGRGGRHLHLPRRSGH